jgi:hypothetical protein
MDTADVISVAAGIEELADTRAPDMAIAVRFPEDG